MSDQDLPRSQQLSFNFETKHSKDTSLRFNDLPELPKVIRYYDDYTDTNRSISGALDVWRIIASGRDEALRFDYAKKNLHQLIKYWCFFLFGSRHPRTAYINVATLLRLLKSERVFICDLMEPKPNIVTFWNNTFQASSWSLNEIGVLRKLLYFFCEFGIGTWTTYDKELLSKQSSGRSKDKFAKVREGSTFLTPDAETRVVSWLDSLSASAQSQPWKIGYQELVAACVIYWAYSHGVRPIQIARLDLSDTQLFVNDPIKPSLQATFRYGKQRLNKRNVRQVRAMKRDWIPLMAEWIRRRTTPAIQHRVDRQNSLFGLSPDEVSRSIAAGLSCYCKVEATATDLRHTAAMRMVDAGASALELAEFMMHSDIQTGQVYYDTSPTQADRINKALGLSPVYSDLTNFIGGQMINRFQMDDLDRDQQIGAAPHGRPIIGIGGCGSGQSMCSKNPGLSCYTCHKFMPVIEKNVHQSARDNISNIVQEYIVAGKDDSRSPAFMQLRRTLESIDSLLDALPAGGIDSGK